MSCLSMELPPEQLVRRQAVHDLRITDAALTDCLPEDMARNSPAKPSHFRQHDVGPTTDGEGVQPLEGLGTKPVVMVAEEHVFAPSGIQADIARLLGPAGIRLVNHPNVRVRRREFVEGVRAESSVEPSSTQMTSNSSWGRLCDISDLMHGVK